MIGNKHRCKYPRSELCSWKAGLYCEVSIALKECYETEYWLEVFVKSDMIGRESAKEIYNQCGTIRRMLIASINTTKDNLNKSE